MQQMLRRLRNGPGSSAEADSLLARHLVESDRLLLAALKLARSPGVPFTSGFRAVPIGTDRLLAAHPRLPFLYLDARDQLQTPFIVAEQYEPEVLSALDRLVQPGMKVIELGAGQGYHTLTLAQLVGTTGKVVAVEQDPVRFAVLRDNVVVHELASFVTPILHRDLETGLLELIETPDLVRIAGNCGIGQSDPIVRDLLRKPGCRVLLGVDVLAGGLPEFDRSRP
jgi:hypothetical protein